MIIQTNISLDKGSRDKLIQELEELGFDKRNLKMLQDYPFIGILYRELKQG